MPGMPAPAGERVEAMERVDDQREREIRYIFTERELKEDLGIREAVRGVYWSSSRKKLTIFCARPREQK